MIGTGPLDLPLVLEAGDLVGGQPEDAQPVARRVDRGHGGAQVLLRRVELGLRLLPVLQRARLALVEALVARLVEGDEREFRARPVARRDRGEEIVLRRDDLGAVDLEQRRALADPLAEPRHQAGHPAGERRQHDRADVLVVGDLADREFFQAERTQLDLGDRGADASGPR